jgi:hypothetical protein
MSVQSLVNFGVPGQNGDRSAVLQPINTQRFRVTFYNFGNPGESAPYDLTRAMRSTSTPKANFEEVPLYSYVSTVYIPTKVEWEPITMRLFDDIDNTVSTRVHQQVSKQHNFFDQTASRAGQNFKFEFDIDVLAGGASATGNASDPNIIKKWCVVGAFLSNYETSELSYENAGPGEITLNIRFDNAVCYDAEGNRLGTFDHGPEIDGRVGSFSTGAGGFI